MLRSVIVAVVIGVLGGLWVGLVSERIEVFQNYVEGAWRYQIAVNSAAGILVGAVVGALAGANIRLGLAPERVDGFTRGAIAGLAGGVLLALAQVALLVLAAIFEDYRVFYQPLLTRLSGILFAASVIGAAAGLLKAERPLAAPISGAVAGALTAAAFVLPAVATTMLSLASSSWDDSLALFFFLNISLASHLSVLIAGAGSGAIVGAVLRRKWQGELNNTAPTAPSTIGVLLGALAAVTASSPSFIYVVFGLFPSESSFSLALYVFRALLGLLCGGVVGVAAAFAVQRIASTRPNDASTTGCSD